MSLIDLRRRLERIEAGRNSNPPTAILSDRPADDPAAALAHADALANWRRWVADGRATLANGVLCLVGPEMTVEEWIARHVTAH